MKRLLVSLFLLTWSPAIAQVPMTGAGQGVPAATPPTVSYVSSGTPANSSPTFTIASANIGNPAYIGTRRVILAVSGGLTSRTISSFSINGVTTGTITNVAGATSTDGCYFVSALVPTGTTGVSVSVTFSSSQFGSIGFALYNVDNSLLSSATPTTGFAEVSAATTGSVTVGTTSGGFIITSMESTSGTTANNISASTESFTLDLAALASANSFAHANAIATNASSSITWSWTGAATVAGLCAAAWR